MVHMIEFLATPLVDGDRSKHPSRVETHRTENHFLCDSRFFGCYVRMDTAHVIRHRPRFSLLLKKLAMVTVVGLTSGISAAEFAQRNFDRALLLETTSETSAGVSIGDLNGDGILDIVLAKGRHWPLFNRVLLSDGHGHFSASNLGTQPDRTYSAALADLNGNGSLDIVVSNDEPDQKLIYLNDGTGHFRAAGTFGSAKWGTRYVTLADLNGDGFPDIIAANRGAPPEHPEPSYVCFNDGHGNFGPGRALPTDSATIIVAADFDGDGAIDLFVPHRDGGQSAILWNNRKGEFLQSTPIGPSNAHIRAAVAGHLYGGQRPDIVVGDEVGKRVVVYHNLGHRTFRDGPILTTGDVPFAIALADLNRDGTIDVAIGNAGAPGTICFNKGGSENFEAVRWNDGKGAVYAIAVGDMDGDGWPDLATARSDAPNAIWLSEPRVAVKQ